MIRDPRADVHGLLFDLALPDVPALDRYEGIGQGLYSKIIQPVLMAQGARKALVYIGRSAKPGVARPGYLEGVVAAARAAGLPDKYIATLDPTAVKASELAGSMTFRALGQKGR